MTTTTSVITSTILNFKGEGITSVVMNGTPYFLGSDVAKVLSYVDYKDAVSKVVDDCYKTRAEVMYKGEKREVTLINELGVFDLIKGSCLKDTRDFKVWLLREVLPSIHKYGTYLTPQEADDNYQQLARKLESKNQQINAYMSLIEQRREEIQNLLKLKSELQDELRERKLQTMYLEDENFKKTCKVAELSRLLHQK